MLPSLLPLLASFFNVLLLPQKVNRFYRFRFHIPELDTYIKQEVTQQSLHKLKLKRFGQKCKI